MPPQSSDVLSTRTQPAAGCQQQRGSARPLPIAANDGASAAKLSPTLNDVPSINGRFAERQLGMINSASPEKPSWSAKTTTMMSSAIRVLSMSPSEIR